MHQKYSWNWKNPKNSVFWANIYKKQKNPKNPKNPKKNRKTQKNPGFFQPCLEPARVHAQRRRIVQNVGIAAFARALLEVGHRALRHQVGAARVDLVHEVVLLHRGLLRPRERDGARVVDHDVNAAKVFHSLPDLLIESEQEVKRCIRPDWLSLRVVSLGRLYKRT